MEGGEYQTARDCKRFQLPIGTGIDLELGIIIFNIRHFTLQNV